MSGKINEAYALLSDEIKQTLFPTIEIFRVDYFDRIFNEFRRHTVRAWVSHRGINTYVVEIMEDALVSRKNIWNKHTRLFHNQS